MEKDFRAQSWLGIIKGANMHVDFSSTENFDTSFDELIRQIDFVERQLSLRPRTLFVLFYDDNFVIVF